MRIIRSMAPTITNIAGNMKKISFLPTVRGFASADAPATQQILRISAPIMFPTAMAPCFLRAATIQVATSGIEVPNATMVRAIIASGMPNE